MSRKEQPGNSQGTQAFPHSRLRAYHHAIAAYRLVVKLRCDLPTGLASLYDQLKRASMSLCLNIAEGASEQSQANTRRYFRIALSSAGEAAAALELIEIEMNSSKKMIDEAYEELNASAALTVGLIRRL